MKKTLTLCAVITGLNVYAQTITWSAFSATITQPQNIVLGDQSTFNLALTTTTGNGVMWNASGLVQQPLTPNVQLVYASPGTTPHAALYPASNYVIYDPALTSVIGYNYIHFGTDSVVDIGSYEPSTEHEIFQNPDKHLVFPFAYGQSFTDTYAKTNYSDATTVSSYQTGTRTVTFSGYGTLLLPQDTFTAVALVSELRTNSLGPNSNSYTWYRLSDGKKLLFYSNNAGDITLVYNTDMATGIADIQAARTAQLAPNPFSETTLLTLPTALPLRNSELRITDLHGRLIRKSVFDGNSIRIDRGGQENGIYLYTVITENGEQFTGKLISR